VGNWQGAWRRNHRLFQPGRSARGGRPRQSDLSPDRIEGQRRLSPDGSEQQLRQALAEIKQLKEHLVQENVYLRQEASLLHSHEHVVGQSPVLKKAFTQAEQVAGAQATILLLGETGAGKELVARALHQLCSLRGRGAGVRGGGGHAGRRGARAHPRRPLRNGLGSGRSERGRGPSGDEALHVAVEDEEARHFSKTLVPARWRLCPPAGAWQLAPPIRSPSPLHPPYPQVSTELRLTARIARQHLAGTSLALGGCRQG
jgi:hypothetical protein